MITVSTTPTAVAISKTGGLATLRISTTAVQPVEKGDILNIAGATQGVVSKISTEGTASVIEIPCPTGNADSLRLSVQELIDGSVTLSFTRKDG